jgi:hypothetical protein
MLDGATYADSYLLHRLGLLVLAPDIDALTETTFGPLLVAFRLP